MPRLLHVVTLLFIAALSFSQASQAQTNGAGPSIPFFSVPVTEQLGRALYRYDQAAARASDRLLADGLDPAREGIRGWVMEATEGGGLRVRFLRLEGDTPVAAYDIDLDAAGEPLGRATRAATPLTASQLAQFRARQLALSQVTEPCSRTYNTVVLRHPEQDAWLVYALAATDQPGVIVAGGHYRVSVSSDGRQLIEANRLSRSCIMLPPTPPGAVGAYMTHILTPMPIETHVFLSLLHGKPLYVGTSDGRWIIENGQIKRMPEKQ